MSENVASAPVKEKKKFVLNDGALLFIFIAIGLIVVGFAGTIFLTFPMLSVFVAIAGVTLMFYGFNKAAFSFEPIMAAFYFGMFLVGMFFVFSGAGNFSHNSPDPESVFDKGGYTVIDTVDYSDSLCDVDGGHNDSYVSYAVKNKEGVFVGIVERQGYNKFFDVWNDVELKNVCKVIDRE